MRSPPKNRIPQWLKIYFIFINIALISLGLWFFKFQEQTQRREVETHLLDLAQLKARQIADWRKERLADAEVLMHRQSFIHTIEEYSSHPSPREASDILKQFAIYKQQYGYSDILLVNLDNEILLSLSGNTDAHKGFIDESDSAFAAHQPLWTKLHPEITYPFPHLSVVTPLFYPTESDHRIGCIILICDARQFLHPLIESWPVFSKTAETLLIRKEGDDVLFLNELRHKKNTALQLHIPIQQADLPAAMAVSGKTGIVNGRDYRDVPVIAAILPVPGSPWYIVSKMDRKEAFSQWHFRAFLILSLLIGSISLVLIAGLLIWQRDLKIQYQKLYQSESALRISLQKQAITLDAIGDAVISTDAKGCVELMNPVAENLTGWQQDEARGKDLTTVFRIVNEETRKTVENPVTRVLEKGVIVGLANHTLLIHKNGHEIPIADSGAPIRDESGRIIGVVLVFRDQSEERLNQKLIEMRLAFIEYSINHSIHDFLAWTLDKIEAFMESVFSVYYVLDTDEMTPVIRGWSANLDKKINRSKRMSELIHQSILWKQCGMNKRTMIQNDVSDVDAETAEFLKIIDVNRFISVPVVREGKAVAACCICGKKTDYTDKDAEIIAYFADLLYEITLQKQTMEALIRSEELLNTTGKLAKIGGWTHNYITGEAMWTHALYDIVEIPHDQKPPPPAEHLRYYPEESRKILSEAIKQAIENKTSFDIEIPAITAARKSIWCRVQGEPDFENNECTGMHGTLQDITDRKKAEEAFTESQRKLATLMSNLPGLAYRCKMDSDWTMEFISDGCIGLTGYQPEDLIDNAVISYANIIHPEDREMVEEIIKAGVIEHKPFQIVCRIQTKEGEEKWVWEQGQGIFNSNNELIALEGFITDITDKKIAEDRLEKSLKEKEVLLRELYHRTKNNMQVISSLLHLKSYRIKDDRVQFMFQEIENKIHSMALVHKKLYESNDLSSLNLKTYFEDLIHLIRSSYTIDENQITFTYNAVDAIVLIDTAIPLGLVLNELLSNSVKYAFPNGRKGEIKITLSKGKGKKLIIEVSDNGVGLPASFDMKNHINLGLETVMDLITNQLRSEITLENHNGLKYRIVISEELYEPRI